MNTEPLANVTDGEEQTGEELAVSGRQELLGQHF